MKQASAMAHSTMVSKILVGAWLSAAVLTWAIAAHKKLGKATLRLAQRASALSEPMFAPTLAELTTGIHAAIQVTLHAIHWLHQTAFVIQVLRIHRDWVNPVQEMVT